MKKMQIKNTAGMFDFLKGITMLLVVIVHTFQEFTDYDFGKNLNFLGILMVALFVISGYGYRKKSLSKSIAQQARLILIPYSITALFTSAVHLLCHYINYRSVKNAVIQTLKVFVGFVLGISETTTIHGFEIFSCGALWYLLALFWAWILMYFLISYVPEKWQFLVAFVVTFLGLYLSFTTCAPFGFFRGMFGLFFVYTGYYCKKNKLFINEWKTSTRLLLLGSLGLIIIVMLLKDMLPWIAILVMPLSLIYPPVLVKIFLYLNNIFRGFVANKIRTIGRYSMYFLCVHSVEGKALPWYMLDERINTSSETCVMIVIRIAMDLFLCALVVYTVPRLKNVIEDDIIKH
ncbi:acyltransferase family protein [Pseudobutyrivibrio ruminis]|uniref:acyltransferase family protein n=1 Tax=Pseudobutyrivibrio ruminis TaxID=46206 RepID=UPI00041C8256|nr:acyltransferase [Pseudobutyrivibrio ruminis]